MEVFSGIFNTILYRPLFNILIALYVYLPIRDFGLAVIALTLLVKLIFYPLGLKGIKSQKQLSDLQPKIKELQEKYKDQKDRQVKEIMELYKKEKINPFSGCLPLLVQLPFLVALYRVFWRGLDVEQMSFLYGFVPNPGAINPSFFGLIDLSGPWIPMAVLAGVLQFLQTKMVLPPLPKSSSKTSDFSGAMQKQMQYFMPFITVLFLFNLPSALGLYIIITTLFSIGQQYFILKPFKTASKPA